MHCDLTASKSALALPATHLMLEIDICSSQAFLFSMRQISHTHSSVLEKYHSALISILTMANMTLHQTMFSTIFVFLFCSRKQCFAQLPL